MEVSAATSSWMGIVLGRLVVHSAAHPLTMGSVLQVVAQTLAQRAEQADKQLPQRLAQRLAVLRFVQEVHAGCQLQAEQAQVRASVCSTPWPAARAARLQLARGSPACVAQCCTCALFTIWQECCGLH